MSDLPAGMEVGTPHSAAASVREVGGAAPDSHCSPPVRQRVK